MNYVKRWWSDGLAVAVAIGSAVAMLSVDPLNTVFAVAIFMPSIGSLAYLAYRASHPWTLLATGTLGA